MLKNILIFILILLIAIILKFENMAKVIVPWSYNGQDVKFKSSKLSSHQKMIIYNAFTDGEKEFNQSIGLAVIRSKIYLGFIALSGRTDKQNSLVLEKVSSLYSSQSLLDKFLYSGNFGENNKKLVMTNFWEASKYYFNKELNELNESELIELLSVWKSKFFMKNAKVTKSSLLETKKGIVRKLNSKNLLKNYDADVTSSLIIELPKKGI